MEETTTSRPSSDTALESASSKTPISYTIGHITTATSTSTAHLGFQTFKDGPFTHRRQIWQRNGEPFLAKSMCSSHTHLPLASLILRMANNTLDVRFSLNVSNSFSQGFIASGTFMLLTGRPSKTTRASSMPRLLLANSPFTS